MADRSATAALGGAQRQSRMALQFIAGNAVLRSLGNTDAGADLPRLIHVERRGERLRQPLAELVRELRILARDDGRESVILEAAEYGARRQRRFEPLGDAAQHDVAAGVAQRVVDVVEAVDVDQREGDEARTARRDRFVQAFEHHAPVRQPGQRILRGELADRCQAARERSTEPPRRAHRNRGRRGERDPDQAEQPPQPGHCADKAAIRRPAEPADDAALRVMQRLHFAPAVGGQRGVEAEIVEAGAAGDAAELVGIEMLTLRGSAIDLAKRRLQSVMLLGRKAAAAALGFGQADCGAGEHRNRQDQRGDRATARRPCRRA